MVQLHPHMQHLNIRAGSASLGRILRILIPALMELAKQVLYVFLNISRWCLKCIKFSNKIKNYPEAAKTMLTVYLNWQIKFAGVGQWRHLWCRIWSSKKRVFPVRGPLALLLSRQADQIQALNIEQRRHTPGVGQRQPAENSWPVRRNTVKWSIL
jgi:hypothetical protein